MHRFGAGHSSLDLQSVRRSTTMLLENFPPNVLVRILRYLPKDDLASLRLLSRVFRQLALPFLCRQFTLRYSVASAAKARDFITRPDLARLVREYRLDANLPAWVRQADPFWNNDLDLLHSQITASDGLYMVMRHLARLLPFRGVHSVSIIFGAPMNEPLIGTIYVSQMFSLAMSSLESLFSSRPSSPGLYELSIEKLPSEHYTICDTRISQYLRDIRRLEIDTIISEMIGSNQSDVACRGAVDFYDRFPQVFLAPASHNLRILHLSANAPWGWYPKIDFRKVRFPHLERLTLTRFTFSHDWQVYWLGDHDGTLKHLRLINCAILCHAESTTQTLKHEGYPYMSEHYGDPNPVVGSYRYETRWCDLFNQFSCVLLELQSFSLVAPDAVARDSFRQDLFDEEKQACCARDRYLDYTTITYTSSFDEGAELESEQEKQDKRDRSYLASFLVSIKFREPRDVNHVRT